MSDTKWTKGPWHVCDIPGNRNLSTVCKLTKTVHVFVDHYVCDDPVNDARLISAAPDNYEANEWLLDAVKLLLEGKPVKDLDERILFSEKALAKARGE